MYKCEDCQIEQELSNFYDLKTKLGHDKKCKSCRKIASRKSYENKNKDSKRKQTKAKKTYRKTKGLINPKNPIPLRNVGEDGFGGKWRYDQKKLDATLKNFISASFLATSFRKIKGLQVKCADLNQLMLFATNINLHHDGIIHIKRESGKQHLETYVVNLYNAPNYQTMKG